MTETMASIDPTTFPNQNPKINNETPDANSPESLPPVDKSPFRRIEFQLAKKPFSGFNNGGVDGSFRLETLNPNSICSKSGSGSQLSTGPGSGSGSGLGSKRDASEMENGLDSELSIGITFKRIGAGLENLGISRTFRNSRQEDAHEYMVNLLESMHKCCLPNGVPSESQSAYDRSLVHKIFGGRLRSQVKCMQCNYCSNKFDPFLDLSLEILKADSLYKAFANFTAKEQLDGGAKQYQCQQCKQKVKALKQLTIHKAPNVLTVHLKRFGSHIPGQKIDKQIQFGSTLDLKPFVTGADEGDLKYTLYGVLVHAGWSTHSGHYYCFVRTSSGMWYSLDDNRVYQVSEKKVFEQKAYMLFYFKDRKKIPLKKTTADVHQKEKIVMNGKVNGPGVAKEAQLKTGPHNGSLNEISPVAPKEAQMKTGLSNILSIGQNSLANVDSEISGLTKTNLINGLSNDHETAVTVVTVKNVFSSGVQEQIQKKEGLISKSVSESTFESSLKSNNCDFSDENIKPLAIPLDTASKTENTLKDIGIGESSGGNKSGDIQINEASTALPKVESSLEIKPYEKKPRKKLKNFLKCKRISMKFSSNFFIGSSLNQKKKMKHKQSKRVKNLAQEIAVNEGPSSSVKIEKQLTVKPPVENGFKAAVNKDAVIPTTDYNVVSNGIRSKPGRLDSCEGASTQKDLVHMLTRGSDEIVVPRWDEDGSTPSQQRVKTADLKIGYIGDEWDQEYDRGKQKKVRMSQTEFDGKNPFQSIANERLKTHAQNQNLSRRRPPTYTQTENKQFKKPRSGNNEPYRI